MTQEQAKELWPVIKLWSEGRQMQFKHIEDSGWQDYQEYREGVEGCSFRKDYLYRIKPEPQYRPWKPEEVPVGALLRSEAGQEFIIMGRQGIYSDSVEISAVNTVRGGWQSFTVIPGKSKYSTDFGKTWQPCGVLV